MLVRTSSVFLLVFGLWKSVSLVHSFSTNEKLFEEEKHVKTFDSNPIRTNVAKFNYPIVINTWPFVNATAKAWQVLADTDDRLDASMCLRQKAPGANECSRRNF